MGTRTAWTEAAWQADERMLAAIGELKREVIEPAKADSTATRRRPGPKMPGK